jgi:hypothetical protein
MLYWSFFTVLHLSCKERSAMRAITLLTGSVCNMKLRHCVVSNSGNNVDQDTNQQANHATIFDPYT